MPNDRTEQEQEFLDACAEMTDADREKIIRLTERIANKPSGMTLTKEQMQAMFDNDSELPLH
ncbi:hypothetical protein CAter282_4330 [Collimonas arenae]|uniref:Uncharacterized protein n=1 Tax=Collimonas arenae TaxID=279058 RepID=A0A127PWX9_9BURK|nr:hypothetical protein [Collimonas arenae]AMP02095.1 hypothetical protein CAter10_4705 [Collimonas arenae]AMP11990.1 hypothetical protein CAter282_4330 [Collimonas arenae]